MGRSTSWAKSACALAMAALLTACGGEAVGPASSIKPGTDVIGNWRYQAAQAVRDLLAPQAQGITVLTPGDDSSLLNTLSAAIALEPHAAPPDLTQLLASGYDQRAHLFLDYGTDSVEVTWLAMRWHKAHPEQAFPQPVEAVVGALQSQVSSNAQALTAGTGGSAPDLLFGIRGLAAAGVKPATFPTPAVTCGKVSGAYAARNLFDLAGWLEIAAASSAECSPPGPQADVQAWLNARPTGQKSDALQAAAAEAAAVAIEHYLNLPVRQPTSCTSIGGGTGEFVPQAADTTYRLCADEMAMLGRTLNLSDPSRRKLARDVMWTGRLPDHQQFNAYAIAQMLYVLRTLEFRHDIVAAAARQTVLHEADSTLVDQLLIQAVAEGRSPTPEDQKTVAATAPSDGVRYFGTAAMTLDRSKQCDPMLTERLLQASRQVVPSEDTRDLLYQSVMLRTLDHCGLSGQTADRRQEILTALSSTPLDSGELGSPDGLVRLWQGNEALCQLGTSPAITRSTLQPLLPQPGSTSWSNYTLFAGVRLTEMVSHGCGNDWYAV